MPLTELKIKNLKPQAKQYRAYDTEGLYIQVSPSGGKLWRWKFRYLDKEQVYALGKYPATSLAQARRLRDDAKAMLALGQHPTRQKQAEKLRRAKEGGNTFERVTKLWIENKQIDPNNKTAKQNLERLKQHVFPLIGALPVTEIRTPDIVQIVEQIGKRGTVETAKRTKQLIGQIFRYATQRGLCQYNPATDLRDILPNITEREHHACVPMSEVPVLLQAIEAREKDLSKYALQLLTLTFVRTNELIGAQWKEIDWDKAEWHIPKERMKMKRPHMVPLSKQTLEVLRELHQITGDKAHIFHSPASKSKHMSNGTVLMALRRMGYGKKMTGHGFRTLASTILNEQNYIPDVIERQLAHDDKDKIRSAYNRAEYMLERKKMMQDYADILEKMRMAKNNVLPLKAMAAKKA